MSKDFDSGRPYGTSFLLPRARLEVTWKRVETRSAFQHRVRCETENLPDLGGGIPLSVDLTWLAFPSRLLMNRIGYEWTP